jgi:hypothetical protein
MGVLDKLHSMDDLPWLLMGDFNEILSSDERLGESAGSQRNMYEFGENKCGLVDLGYRGYPFTWENCRDAEANVQKRLDRAVASVSWMSMFHLVHNRSCANLIFRPCPHPSPHGPGQQLFSAKTSTPEV